MSELMDRYRRVEHPLPEQVLSWRLFGAGMEHLGCDGRPCAEPLPHPGPREVLTRVDACGLCFSDIKLIGLGPDHPRIQGRDLQADPTIPGHEASVTVVEVGAEVTGIAVGDRFIVQADVIYQGVPQAYGYAIPGALGQYSLIPQAMLEGDEGNYLLPVDPATGYAAAALVEPWACVNAAYRITHRTAPKPGGITWIIALEEREEYQVSVGLTAESHPRRVVGSGLDGPLLAGLQSLASRTDMELELVDLVDEPAIQSFCQDYADAVGFDDVIIFGEPPAGLVEAIAPHLARYGVLCIMAQQPLSRPLTIDVGRVHYDGIAYVGGAGADAAAGYQAGRPESDLRPGGAAWFIGAGGPMGQMHVQRAIELATGSRLVVVTDLDRSRLDHIENRFGGMAQARGVELHTFSPKQFESQQAMDEQVHLLSPAGYSDVCVLAPVPALVTAALSFAADNALVNVFAGIPIGNNAGIGIDVLCRGVKIIGSSGSRISDLRRILEMVEAGELNTDLSVAAIGGLNCARAGLEAVRDGKYPGKTVIYPHIPELPLMGLEEAAQNLPELREALGPRLAWSKEAEAALLGNNL